MKLVGTLLATLLLGAVSFGAELLAAKVTAIRKYDQGRIVYWEGRVPIYDGHPLYDITIQVGPKSYIVRYESSTGYYPQAWEVGNEIQVKKERGAFMLMKGDEQVTARTVSGRDCIQSPVRSDGLPVLPCP